MDHGLITWGSVCSSLTILNRGASVIAAHMARTPYLAVSPALRRSNGHGEWQPVIRFIQSCFTELLTVLVTCKAGASDLLGSYLTLVLVHSQYKKLLAVSIA